MDAHESECSEKMADIEAWEPNDQVWMDSGSLTRVTETLAEILWRRHRKEKTATAWPCSSCRNSLPDHVRMDEDPKTVDRLFFFLISGRRLVSIDQVTHDVLNGRL